jgi:hypothetical protein
MFEVAISSVKVFERALPLPFRNKTNLTKATNLVISLW